MKKRICLLVITVLIILVACNNSSKMTISATKLTNDEEAIIQLLDAKNTSKIFDFIVDDTVNSIALTYYTLNSDLKWENHGISSGIIKNTSGKIGITMDNMLKISIKYNNKDVFTTKTDISGLLVNVKNASHAISWLAKSSIELDKEIPLLLQVYNNSNTIRSFDPSTYFNPEQLKENDFVIAVTICFSSEKIE